MTIPFVDLFTKAKARLVDLVTAKPPPISPVVRAHKPSDQRLSKTVLPNAARARMPVESFPAAVSPSVKPAAAAPASPMFDPSRKSTARKSVVSEPVAERTISLQLSEILDRLPRESIKPAESFDPSRAIILKASDVEKGMASGKPSVPMAAIYQQAPEIFVGSVTPGDTTLISLPFSKVLEQFNQLRIRPDQEHDLDVPQLETPFLKVTLEDTERFGTAIEPLQTSPLPPVKVEPATAKTIAAAEPEAVARSASSRPKIALRDLESPTSAIKDSIAPMPPANQEGGDSAPTPAPKKIPFHLPPNGTGAPASERVPASSGPPVPTISESAKSTTTKQVSMPSPAAVEASDEKTKEVESKKIVSEADSLPAIPSPPPRVPFKFPATSSDIRPKLTLVPGVEPKETPAAVEKPKPVIEQPKLAAEQLKPAVEERKPVIEQPKSRTEQPKPSIEEAKQVVEQPRLAIEQPKRAIEQPKLSVEQPKPTIVLRPSSPTAEAQEKISLSLQSLLTQVPAFQLNGSPMGVPEDVQVTFPLALIEPQLSSGRVIIPAKTFQRAMPEAYRDLLVIDPNETPVSLPLQEVVKHLPPTTLRVRDDQEEATLKEKFTTPFSIQAAEDAKRFDAMAEAVRKSEDVTEEPSESRSAIQTKAADNSRSDNESRAELQSSPRPAVQVQITEIASKQPELDAKTAVARAAALPGIASCDITFADGLGLAGNIPPELAIEGVSAIAASVLEKIDNHIDDTSLGELVAMTVNCAKSTLTFFRHGNICLTVLHSSPDGLTPKIRGELSQLTRELSQTYPQVELSHVDH